MSRTDSYAFSRKTSGKGGLEELVSGKVHWIAQDPNTQLKAKQFRQNDTGDDDDDDDD
jgi:hypothetical protein